MNMCMFICDLCEAQLNILILEVLLVVFFLCYFDCRFGTRGVKIGAWEVIFTSRRYVVLLFALELLF